MRRKSPQVTHTPRDVPAPLALGPCVEVWADEDAPAGDWPSRRAYSARRNFRSTRDAWLFASGVTEVAQKCELIPMRPPFSILFIAKDRVERAAELMSMAGASIEDLPRLRREAVALMASLNVEPSTPWRPCRSASPP